MQIKINDKDYQLFFGLDFLEWCEDNEGMKVEGVNLGIGGFNMIYSKLEMHDPVTVMKIIKGATNTHKSKPSRKDIEAFLVELLEEDKFEEFVEEVISELKKQPFTKVQIKQIESREIPTQE